LPPPAPVAANLPERVLLDGDVETAAWTRSGGLFTLIDGDGRKVRVLTPGDPPSPGSHVTVYAEPLRARGGDPGRTMPRESVPLVRAKGTDAIFVRDQARTLPGTFHRIRYHLRARLGDAYSGQHRALARALLVGDRSGLDPRITEAFRSLGLSHLLAISGMHVGLIAGLIIAVARTLRPAGRTWGPIVGALLVFYAPIAGAGGSVVRAVMMGVLALLFFSVRRRVDPMNILSITLLVTSAMNPAEVTRPGYALSYLATGGILLVVTRARRRRVRRLWRRPATWLSISVAAAAATFPVVAACFGAVPLGGVLYSIPGGLLVAAAIIPGFIGLLISPLPVVSELCFSAGWVGLELLLRIADLRLPAPAIDIPPESALALVFLGTAGATAWRARWPGWCSSAVLVACSILSLCSRPERGAIPELVLFDVGAGDALLLRLPNGDDWLIDTGRPERVSALARGLRALRANDVRLLVTHPDADHDGGVPELLRLGIVGEIVVPVTEVDALSERYPLAEDVSVRTVTRGDTLWRASSGEMICLHPTASDADLPDNERSLVARLNWHGVTLLLTGDLEGEGEARLLERSGPDALTADVLKVAHHGSGNATSEPFIHAVRPRLSLISCGRDVPAGTIRRLAIGRNAVYRTDEVGAIRLRMAENRLIVERWWGRWRRLACVVLDPMLETPNRSDQSFTRPTRLHGRVP